MESVGFVLAGGVRLSQGKVRESWSSRRKGQVYNGGGRRVWVFAQVASTGEMGEAVSEKRAQEILEKRIAESKARVDFLSSRVIVRDAESCVAEAEGVMAVEYEQFFADSEEGKQELSENRDKFMQELSEALEKLQRCLKELRLIETQHENAVDASETIARIYQSVEVLSAISQRLTDAPVPEKSDSSSRLAVDEIREEVRQRVVRVGQGLEKRVGQFVREDGSIDFPEITSAARVTVTKSSEIWARLNGVTPEGASLQQAFEESPVMWELRSTIEQLEKKLDDASRKREKRLRKEDQLGKLIKARELREMDDSVNTVRRMLAVTVLQLELERIYLYLRNEVETTSDFMDQQLLIREFGQMDERLSILKVYVDESQVLLVDDDELGELAGDVAFMKSRVGLENDFYTTTFDWPKAKRTLFDGVGKMKEGTEFFFRGLRLLAGDVAYAFRLIRKAAVGFILSPREVRTLRRTGRDLISFIPFSIILLLPLTPIGHVLVFSFIQRFFPDFFPTTFSERRQQLMKRYEQMRKTMDPTIDVEQMHKTSMVGGGKLSAPGLGREGDNSVASHSIDDVHLAE